MHVFVRNAQNAPHIHTQIRAVHQSLCNTFAHQHRHAMHGNCATLVVRYMQECISGIAMRRGNGHSLNTSREYIVQYKTNNPQRSSRMLRYTSHLPFSLNGVPIWQSLCRMLPCAHREYVYIDIQSRGRLLNSISRTQSAERTKRTNKRTAQIK